MAARRYQDVRLDFGGHARDHNSHIGCNLRQAQKNGLFRAIPLNSWLPLIQASSPLDIPLHSDYGSDTNYHGTFSFRLLNVIKR